MNDASWLFSSGRRARAIARRVQARHLSLAACTGLLLACSAAPSHEGGVGAGASALDAEKPDGETAILVKRKYGVDASVTLASYAAPSIGGCSASMIGPNVLMTAGHCGYEDAAGNLPDATATFKVARAGGWSDIETFLCHKLFATWGGGAPYDLQAMYCEPNARGENPGNKYGYLDIDASTPAVGQAIYSLWANSLDSTGEGDARLFSRGTVAVIGGNKQPANMTMWGQPGASGSPHLNAANNRVLIGPLSTAGGMSRNAFTMDDYLTNGQLIPWSPPGRNVFPVNSVLLVKLLPELFANEPNKDTLHELARYRGAVDKNGNKLFDVQEDIEKYRGENARDWYALGFESDRQNAVWETTNATMDPARSQVQIATPSATSAAITVLRHRGLHLKPSTTYRVSLQLDVRSASRSDGLRVSLRGAQGEQDGAEIPTVANGQGFHFQTFTLRTSAAGNPDLELVARGQLTMGLAVVDIVEEGAVMRFDTSDQRNFWKNDGAGGRAFILPDGEDSDGLPNWAGLVRRTPSIAQESDWPMRNGQLAFVAGRDYRVCFDVQGQGLASSTTTIPTTSGDWGVMRVWSGSQEAIRSTFTPTKDWSTVCTTAFHVGDPNTLMQLGVKADTAIGYLVDNVRILPATSTAGATGIHVLQATYAANRGAAGGNATQPTSFCEGRATCDVDVLALPDPALGFSKDFAIDWVCDGNPRAHRIYVPAIGASTASLRLSCPGIHVTEATYGGNVGVARGNVTADVAMSCAGAAACDYAVDYRVLGDPAAGLGKNFVVNYTCDGDATVRSTTLAAEAGFGSRAQLACPTVTPKITVIAAAYGGNTGRGLDLSSAVATACDGTKSCAYVVDWQVVGDPAVGVGKDFSVQYTCAAGGVRKTLILPAEAGNKATALLHCP